MWASNARSGEYQKKQAYSTRCPYQPSPCIIVNTGYISRILLVKPTNLCKEVIYRFLCKGKNITLARKMVAQEIKSFRNPSNKCLTRMQAQSYRFHEREVCISIYVLIRQSLKTVGFHFTTWSIWNILD